MLLLLTFAAIALGVSFLCSMLEATLLSVSASHLAMRVEQGSSAARYLQKMKSEVDRPLSAILTLNTVAHTVGAVGVGAQATALFGSASVGVTSAVMTVLILVLSEIIPKTLGAVHAKSLTGFTAVNIRLMMFITFPIVVLLQSISRLLAAPGKTETLTRSEFVAATLLGRQTGSLDAREYQTVRNLVMLSEIKLAEILTPRTVLMALPEAQTLGEVMADARPLRYARMPVYGASLDDVTGYVTRFELTEAYRAGELDAPLSQFKRPIQSVPEQGSVSSALDLMLQHREHILLVVDEYGGLEGIVTLEDAIETLLGIEIVDETDATTDLQALARRRARRIRRRQEKAESPEGDRNG